MKRKLFLSILIVFFTTSFMSLVGCNNQKSTKEQSSVSKTTPKEDYELQEKCGKRCEEIFKREYNGYGLNRVLSYQNHYNRKLNKCFVVVTKGFSNKKESNYTKEIEDVNESKNYGTYSINSSNYPYFRCDVSGKTCHSQQEWNSLVKLYMEE